MDNVFFCPIDGTPLSASGADEDLSFAQYELLGTIGKGGMGAIYKARHRIMDRIVAIKVLLRNRMTADDVQRFQREGKAVSKLNHPNIIGVMEFGVADNGSPFMVMEYVDGFSLSELIKKRGALAIAESMSIALQICSGMEHAHQAGILHRDLKPSNIMLTRKADGKYKVKIVDFGIAKISQGELVTDATLTKTGEIFGSPNYMSPEQASGLIPDQRTDIYSTGCIIYEMLTGSPPLEGINLIDTLSRQIQDKPLPLKEAAMGKKFPNSLEILVAKALEKDPQMRFQNFSELGEAISASSQGQIAESSLHWSKQNQGKNTLVISLVGLLLLVVLGIFSLPYLTNNESQQSKSDPEFDELKNQINNQSELAKSELAKYALDVGEGLLKEGPPKKRPEMVGIIRSAIKEGELIDLNYTMVTKDELEEISKHKAIAGLHLDETRLGDIIFDYIKHVQMPSLSLRNSWVSNKGLSQLGEMQTLTDLDIGRFDKRPRKDPSAPTLTAETLKQIARLHNLTTLGVRQLAIDDDQVGLLVPLKNLRSLDLYENPKLTNKVLKYLEQFPVIADLNLHGDNLITIDALTNCKFIPQLKSLALPNKTVNDDSLKKLMERAQDLERLDISYAPVTDESLKMLAKYKNLNHLNLQNCKTISAEAIQKLGKDLPGCIIESRGEKEDILPEFK